MTKAIANLRDVSDPKDRALGASALLDRLQVSVKEVSRIRREAVEEMLRGGMTQAQVGAELGMSRGRVGQLVASGPPPERFFFGDGRLTVAMGAKLEAGKDKPGAVLAQEDFLTFTRFAELLAGLQLDAEPEMVPPPGNLRLNRSNLVVICGPRLSPLLGQILESDPVLGFECVDNEWRLLDRKTETTYRSPLDDGESGDIAYFGRLNRPDGKGTFTYMAGIHASGPAGVVHYLNNHLGEIYREVKLKRFSTLIESRTNVQTGEVTSSRRLTPLYVHEGH